MNRDGVRLLQLLATYASCSRLSRQLKRKLLNFLLLNCNGKMEINGCIPAASWVLLFDSGPFADCAKAGAQIPQTGHFRLVLSRHACLAEAPSSAVGLHL
jgi:hypothetical protein